MLPENTPEMDLGSVLGAEFGDSHEVLVLFIPDRDRDGNEIGDQRRWVPEAFEERLGELRTFLHRLGRDTRQGEVGVEFSGGFWRIREFEP